MLLISLLLPGTQLAADSPKPASVGIDVSHLVSQTARPDYDKEVLAPLKRAQAQAAVKATQAAQEAAEQAQQAAAQQQAAQQAQAAVQPVKQRETVSGTCSQWLAAAGVTDTANAMILINMESGCNPLALNPSSGACGVAQELPCGKSGCNMDDGACQVAWMNKYCIERYGSWANAVAWHLRANWY